MRVELWRATDNTETYGSGACFASDEEFAAEYLDNQGYGGGELLNLTLNVDREDVLSLVTGQRGGVPYGPQSRDAWRLLAEYLDVDERELRADSQNVIHEAIDRLSIRKRLNVAGFEWVVYEDTFPEGAVTWTYLGPLRHFE